LYGYLTNRRANLETSKLPSRPLVCVQGRPSSLANTFLLQRIASGWEPSAGTPPLVCKSLLSSRQLLSRILCWQLLSRSLCWHLLWRVLKSIGFDNLSFVPITIVTRIVFYGRILLPVIFVYILRCLSSLAQEEEYYNAG
jgi:hypothetical protein